MGRVIASFGQVEPEDLVGVQVQGEEYIPQVMSMGGTGRRPGQLVIGCNGRRDGDPWAAHALAQFLVEHLSPADLAEMMAELQRQGIAPAKA